MIRILHLEDNPDDAELVAMALRGADLAGGLVQVDHGPAYASALESGAFDVVLSDYSLPGFDGLRALALLRERRLEIPFILVSGTIGEEKAIEVIREGATDFVLKDRLTRLESIVRRAVEEAAQRRGRRQAEEQLLRQREALYQSEKLAAMGTLLASVAHELNNPLSVVLGQANLLRRDAVGGPLVARADKIEKAAERCARIVANFLALARQRPPERRAVALRQIVEAAVELLAYSLQQDSVEVRLELADDVPCIQADGHQLQQVLINLVTNAHHALREAPPPRRVTVRTRRDSLRELVVLEVLDTGAGVPPELRQRIFEPFFTTKPADRGTGLGLPLCLEIVQGHGGTMGVGPAEGGGAAFWIELPVCRETAALERPCEQSPDAAVDGRSILVVDDEPDVAEVLAETLRTRGHHVDVAHGGVAGLARLAKGRYDLVFTDIKMPDLDGKKLFREAAGLDPSLPRRFVFTTGDGLSSETQGFFEATHRPILRKPFDLAEVHHVVARVLAAR